VAKRLSLKVDYFEDYYLLSIVSQLKDYRLAYFINETIRIDLKKYKDLQVSGRNGLYSWYYFSGGDDFPNYYLIGNNHTQGKIIPSHKGIDYYLLIKEEFEEKRIEEIASDLRKIKGVLGVFNTEMSSLRNLDSLLESVELHELEEIIRPAKKRNGRLTK